VIFAGDIPPAFPAKAATKTIPIVFVIGADPLKVGLVESFELDLAPFLATKCRTSEPKGSIYSFGFETMFDRFFWAT
jgi:hypothetical protein